MSETENYGKKFDYDPLWLGPMCKQRSPTDVRFLKALGIFSVVWLGIAIYAFGNFNFEDFSDIGPSPFGFELNRHKRQANQADNDPNLMNKICFSTFLFTLASIGLSIAYIASLRWSAKFIVYTVMAAILAILFIVTCVTASMYATISSGWSLALFLLCAIVFVGMSILFLFLRKKINIACEVIVEASKCVLFFPSTLLFPLLPCFIFLIVTVFSGTVGIALYVIAVKFDGPLHVTLFHVFNSFGYLWVASFIGSLSQFILSGTFATWFWTHNKNNVPKDTLKRCTKITFNHHLGTIAFGSLILAVCQFIKALLNFIKKRLEGKCNPLACLCCGCYTRLFGRLEKIVRYINRNAYIMCAVHGKSFLESAKDAFNLLMRNVVKAFIISNVTDIILFLGQVFATTLSVLGAYKYCTAENMPQQATSFVLIAVLIISLITTTFISTALRIAIDTIFLCVLEDYERNDGSELQPYYMSFKLKTLFLEE